MQWQTANLLMISHQHKVQQKLQLEHHAMVLAGHAMQHNMPYFGQQLRLAVHVAGYVAGIKRAFLVRCMGNVRLQ